MTNWVTIKVHQPGQGSPQLMDLSKDIIIALLSVQEGDQVRWARRRSGQQRPEVGLSLPAHRRDACRP
ncbi:hypothetical protein [Micromonospora globispora]|uniref:hypothetical protein n=1 Tax=Micromonospora globispora TaxID=1450148 RepID=UPI000F501293|nr:hypothetical protein [Micromonospora globispora]